MLSIMNVKQILMTAVLLVAMTMMNVSCQKYDDSFLKEEIQGLKDQLDEIQNTPPKENLKVNLSPVDEVFDGEHLAFFFSSSNENQVEIPLNITGNVGKTSITSFSKITKSWFTSSTEATSVNIEMTDDVSGVVSINRPYSTFCEDGEMCIYRAGEDVSVIASDEDGNVGLGRIQIVPDEWWITLEKYPSDSDQKTMTISGIPAVATKTIINMHYSIPLEYDAVYTPSALSSSWDIVYTGSPTGCSVSGMDETPEKEEVDVDNEMIYNYKVTLNFPANTGSANKTYNVKFNKKAGNNGYVTVLTLTIVQDKPF